jgi:PhnB protein
MCEFSVISFSGAERQEQIAENSHIALISIGQNKLEVIAMTKPIPDGYHSISPCICFKDTRKAIDFYKRVFGATEKFVMPGPNGRGIMHAELQIGSSIFMMGDENPERNCKSAESFGGSPVSFYLYVSNVDAFFKKAVEGGATVDMPLQDMFWGDRACKVRDPFGYLWMIATHTKDLTPEEIKKGAEAFMCQK